MNRIHGVVQIDRPAEVLFDYITRPSSWPEWYPLTKSVSGPVDHTPRRGEQWNEVIQIAFSRYLATWKTLEEARPTRYVYEGSSSKGGFAKITYTFTSRGNSTEFDRELLYKQDGWWLTFIDWLIGRRIIECASARALQNLKTILESQP